MAVRSAKPPSPREWEPVTRRAKGCAIRPNWLPLPLGEGWGEGLGFPRERLFHQSRAGAGRDTRSLAARSEV